MTALKRMMQMQWFLDLSAEGYSTWSLYDQDGRRWAWIINAPSVGWQAHLGDWGQSELDPPPINSDLKHFPVASLGKEWVEEQIAIQWKDHRRGIGVDHNENTMFKVRKAMEESFTRRVDTTPGELIDHTINLLQSAGILFREAR